MVTVFPGKNFTCFIFSNKFLLMLLRIFILSSGHDLFRSALPQVNLRPVLTRVRDGCWLIKEADPDNLLPLILILFQGILSPSPCTRSGGFIFVSGS